MHFCCLVALNFPVLVVFLQPWRRVHSHCCSLVAQPIAINHHLCTQYQGNLWEGCFAIVAIKWHNHLSHNHIMYRVAVSRLVPTKPLIWLFHLACWQFLYSNMFWKYWPSVSALWPASASYSGPPSLIATHKRSVWGSWRLGSHQSISILWQHRRHLQGPVGTRFAWLSVTLI